MEAVAGVVAGSGVSLPMPSSQSARKERRAVSEHSVRNAGNEDLERSNLGQSEERTIYEVQQRTGPLDVDFCTITMDGRSLGNDIMQISREREELQRMEIELRAQVIARSEIMDLQNRFDAQIKEHANAAAKLKEQLQEREHTKLELEMKMEEKDRELRAIKIDNEAAWAKEDLLREQNIELVTFRRKRDNSEVERAEHLKQIHDFTEHIQEKDRQLLEMEEQHRVAQEAILYKDEQLREAQAWIARVQEMDALQSTTNHSLQTVLQERTEQFNQFWLGCQRQFADLERLHLHTVQQLQLELAEARERSGIYTDESRMVHANAKDVSPFAHNKGSQLNVDVGAMSNVNLGALPNGNVDNVSPFVSSGNATTETDHVPGVPVVPPATQLLGMGAYPPPTQVTALHPFVMHQQDVPHSVPMANSHVPQSHVGHVQPVSTISSHQHWQNRQTVSEGSLMSNQKEYLPSQTEPDLLSSDAHYDYELSANGQVLHSDYLDARVSPAQEPGCLINASSEEAQVLESNGKGYLVAPPHQNLKESSSHFQDASGLESPRQKSETKDEDVITEANHSQDGQSLTTDQPLSATNTSPSDSPSYPVNSSDATDRNASVSVFPEASISAVCSSNLLKPGKILEHTLLDERALLACIVRAIPAGSGGRIRISSTQLPNRLGKMLAPLHWHDYKKKYGKLDDFVDGHPELFVIEGDFIQLREGAQEIISASAAVAKVAAAAAASAPYSSLLPSVAVTPMAQSHRLKKIPSIAIKPMKIVSTETTIATPAVVSDKPSQYSTMQNQHSNGVCSDIVRGLSNVKILSKPKDVEEVSGFHSEIRLGHSSEHISVRNGANPDRTGSLTNQNKGTSNGGYVLNFGGKRQGRASGAALTSRR